MEAEKDASEKVQREEDPAEVTEEWEAGTGNLHQEEVVSLTL